MAKNRVRAAIGLLAVCFFMLPARAASISYSSVPFRSVDYLGLEQILVTFDDVRIEGRFKKVAVPLESVNLLLEENRVNYATLHISNAVSESSASEWLCAEKVIVVVRRKKDFLLWQEFLNKLEKKQKRERLLRETPQRVLPPKDIR